MSKLPNLKPQEVEKILLKAGFLSDTRRGSHQTYYNSKTDRHTTVVFHPGTIPRGTLRGIINQTGMTREEFLALWKKKK